MRLAGAVAVVSGASRGIGRATAGLLAAEGATVVAAARNGNRLEALAGEASGRVQPVARDVAVPTGVARLFRVAAEIYVHSPHGALDTMLSTPATTRTHRNPSEVRLCRPPLSSHCAQSATTGPRCWPRRRPRSTSYRRPAGS